MTVGWHGQGTTEGHTRTGAAHTTNTLVSCMLVACQDVTRQHADPVDLHFNKYKAMIPLYGVLRVPEVLDMMYRTMLNMLAGEKR